MEQMFTLLTSEDLACELDVDDLGDAVVETKQIAFIPLFVDSAFGLGLPN